MLKTCARALTALSLLVIATACGGGENGGTNPPVTVGGFTVSLSSTTLSVQQGASGSVTATISRTGSFTGTVNLSTENVPAGITAAFNPAAITTSTTSTTLTVDVAATVAPGSYTFTIRGQAAGINDQQTATVTMTVTARPSIGLTLTSNAATIPQGGSGGFIARVSRVAVTGFATLTTTGAPTGVTVTFGQVGDSAQFLVQVDDAVPVGTYQLTVTATAAGAAPATATFTLTVVAAPLRLSFSTTNVRVAPGSSTQVTVTLIRNNFTGPVTLSAPSAPGGATITFSPSPTTGNTATMTFAVAAGTGSSNGGFTVLATAPGIAAVSAGLSFDIRPVPSGSIALAVSPSPVTVLVGGPEVYTNVTVTRTNYTGPVNLGVTGGPTGFLAELETNPVLATTSRIVLTAPQGTTPGSYTLTLTGSGPNIDFVSVPFTVNVVAPTGSIAIAATPNALNATAGGTAVTTNIAITRTNFTGDVTFAATGMPGGSQHSFNPSPATGNSTTMSMSFTGSVAAGTYPINVTASGTNIVPVTIQVMVTVAAAPQGSIALSVTQNPVTVQQGGNGGTSIVITRTNFTGQVNLALSGVPANVTATLGSPSTLTNGSTLSFAVGVGATPGNHTVTITGSGTNISNATTTVTLNVTPASGGNVTFTFCGAADVLPIWFAAQNGAGSWTQVAGTNNTYSANITSSGGIAWVTQNGANNFDLTVYYGTAAELTAIGTQQCSTTTGGKTVTGTTAGIGATELASVQFGGRAPATQPTSASPNFTITGVPDGARDLAATRSNLLAGLAVNKIFLKRGLNPANNASVGTVDFGGADAFDPDTKTLSIVGAAGGETVAASVSFSTPNGAALALGLPLTTASGSYPAVPSSRTIAGDLHLLSAFAAPSDGSRSRLVMMAFRDATNTTATLGNPLNTPTVTVPSISGGEARLRVQLTRQAEYQDAWSFTFVQATVSLQRGALVLVTPAYQGAGGTIDVSIPNFSGVSGWQTMWGLQQGTEVTATAAGSAFVSGNGTNADGMVTKAATHTVKLTP